MQKAKYKRIKYPIHTLKEDRGVFLYPDLLPHKEVFEAVSYPGLDPAFELKYLILMYSPGSPSFDEHKHVSKRKTWVLSELGITPDEKHVFSDAINYMLLNQLPIHNRKSSIFRSLQYPMDFQIMLHAEENLTKWLEFSDTEDYKKMPVDDALKLRKLIDEYRKQYEESKERFLAGHQKVTEEWETDLFVAQSMNQLRNESLIDILPKPFVPANARANMIFPEVDEN